MPTRAPQATTPTVPPPLIIPKSLCVHSICAEPGLPANFTLATSLHNGTPARSAGVQSHSAIVSATKGLGSVNSERTRAQPP
mgnify:CR=1 FL=1